MSSLGRESALFGIRDETGEVLPTVRPDSAACSVAVLPVPHLNATDDLRSFRLQLCGVARV